MENDSKRASWDEYFMGMAFMASSRSSCLKFHTGAVIVQDKRVIATGYNGAPMGIVSCSERYAQGLEEKACYKTANGIKDSHKNSGHCVAIHGEENAMQQVGQKDAKGGIMYSVLEPCIECSRRIVNKGIKEVVYTLEYVGEEKIEAERILREGGVKLRRLDFSKERLEELLSLTFEKYQERISRQS